MVLVEKPGFFLPHKMRERCWERKAGERIAALVPQLSIREGKRCWQSME